MKRYKPILSIYFLWHPEFKAGRELADELYRRFSYNVNQPSERSLGIPVLFRSLPANDAKPFPLPVKPRGSEHAVVVPLVDNEAVLDRQWGKYLVNVMESLDLVCDRMLPVFLSPYAHKLPKPLRPLQSFNLASLPESDWPDRLSGLLAHELCRLLLNRDRVAAADGETVLSKAPVKLFLSHAKADGEALAKGFRDYLSSHTVMDSFFDAQDIAPGSDFRDELHGQVERSALLIIRSDAYSGRPWCRREVLHAKRIGCALLLADAVEYGESRNFPYCANMRTLRIKDTSEASMRMIVDATIFEVLRQLYSISLLKYLKDHFELVKQCHLLPRPPELLTLLDLPEKLLKSKSGGTVLYPDPPLGCEELELLNEFNPGLNFYTPTQLTLSINHE